MTKTSGRDVMEKIEKLDMVKSRGVLMENVRMHLGDMDVDAAADELAMLQEAMGEQMSQEEVNELLHMSASDGASFLTGMNCDCSLDKMDHKGEMPEDLPEHIQGLSNRFPWQMLQKMQQKQGRPKRFAIVE
eukprot:853422_1